AGEPAAAEPEPVWADLGAEAGPVVVVPVLPRPRVGLRVPKRAGPEDDRQPALGHRPQEYDLGRVPALRDVDRGHERASRDDQPASLPLEVFDLDIRIELPPVRAVNPARDLQAVAFGPERKIGADPATAP